MCTVFTSKVIEKLLKEQPIRAYSEMIKDCADIIMCDRIEESSQVFYKNEDK